MSPLRPGLAGLVGLQTWAGSGRGWGKVGATDGQKVRVDFFESPAQPEVDSVWLPKDRVKFPPLPRQTRVFWEEGGQWHAGRVLAGDARSGYAVRKPKSFYDIPLDARRLWVRWSRPVTDPVQVLLAGASESPYFAETRLPFVRTIIEQRAACSNVPAILSSAVELYPHQLRAVLQVLRDPIQRYLMADEVGLGKTIEAGLIARQLLLDTPDAVVTFIVPDLLRRQWQDELRTKFFIDDFPRAKIRIVAHESPLRWRGEHALDLVIVDEAHHLVANDTPTEIRKALAEVCHASRRLLLLSATPALHHEQAMLGLLHLLDPAVYRLEDLVGFTARVRARHELASAFYALDPTFPEFVPLHLETIRSAFPHDPRLRSLVDDANEAADHESEGLPQALDRLRAYVNETYRLHRRVIRHRRDRVLAAEGCGPGSPRFEVKGRRNPELLEIIDPHGDAAEELLERWRQSVRDHLVEVAADEETWAAYAWTHAVLMERCRNLAGGLAAAVASRLGDDDACRLAGLDRHETRLLRRAPTVAADEELRRGLSELAMSDKPDKAVARIAEAIGSLCRRYSRILVFAGTTAAGRAVADALTQCRPSAVTVRHLAGEDPSEVERRIQAWIGGDAQVLICDRDGEEGRNFQPADAVVHLQLPWSVNRFEQRLGRVDRHGEGVPAAQYVVAPADPESTMEAWLALLRDGFAAFTDSLSMLQYAVDVVAPTLFLQLLQRGSQALIEGTGWIADTLKQRRKEIAAEDILEATFTSDGERDALFARIDDVEGQWKRVQRAVDNLVCDAKGSLQLARETDSRDRTVRRYRLGEKVLLPTYLLAQSLPGSWDSPGCFNRTAALRRPGTRVLRLGSPTVDSLWGWAQQDDRGQASAWWRLVPKLNGDHVCLGFEYVVDGDIGRVRDRFPDLPATALQRRLDGWFVPFTHRVWLDAWTADHVDPELQPFLELAYEPARGDHNLNTDRFPVLISLFGGSRAFRDAVLRAREEAQSRLRTVRHLEQRAAEADAAAAVDLDRENEQRMARTLAAAHLGGEEDGAVAGLPEVLRQACREPRVRLIAVSCVVLSNRPFAGAASELGVDAH
ncbi:protein DpdE [Micromonospora sp. 050-3]|uniref:protein DpdE n=1 Tax=Micromonospora sp. 050-3 TaxID=2789265 RepID=UPI00397C1387